MVKVKEYHYEIIISDEVQDIMMKIGKLSLKDVIQLKKFCDVMVKTKSKKKPLSSLSQSPKDLNPAAH